MADFERETVWERRERCSMRICAWRLCSPASEGASWWRNAIGSGRQPWLLAEPLYAGRLVRCSLAHCR